MTRSGHKVDDGAREPGGMDASTAGTTDAARLVETLCRAIDRDPKRDTRLATLARQAGCSPATVRRAFAQVLGLTPRQYAEAVRAGRVRRELVRRPGAAYRAGDAVGHRSTTRLYEHAKAEYGMTPGRFKRGGDGETILYASRPCALGVLFVAATEHGVCAVSIGDDAEGLLADLQAELPRARYEADVAALGGWLDEVWDLVEGRARDHAVPLDIQATAFQRRVWLALRAVPYGETRTYRELAGLVGNPAAVRAVARACATNPVALLVPCHRAIRADGGLAGYRWGLERKRSILDREAAMAPIKDESIGH